ncbi:MAG: DUF1566 domain-containing protein [Bdellovibrionales bacterium]
MPNGWQVTIVRQVAQSLTLNSNGTDKFSNGLTNIEMQGNNLQSITLSKLGEYWVITNKTDDCIIGQDCWTADNSSGMKSIYIGNINGHQYFTTPGGCTNSITPTCAEGNDTVQLAWATDAPESTTDINLYNYHDGESQTAILAATETGNAAKFCENMLYAGFDDWYLPATAELELIFQNRASITGIVNDSYVVSNQCNATSSWRYFFQAASMNCTSKSTLLFVRCVRKF